jgi:RNA polymerase sigma factor (sigma-70 family)
MSSDDSSHVTGIKRFVKGGLAHVQPGYDAFVSLAKMSQHIAATGGTTYSDIAETTGGPSMADRQALLLMRRIHTLCEAGPASEPADPTLLARYLDGGDASALAALVRRHGPMVLRAARRVLANAHDADDVFQATFLVLARRATSIRSGESLASWLHGVAYRLALKVRAMAARRQAIERRARPRQPADPLGEMTARELLGLIDEELRRLPEKYRAAVLLCCLEGRTHGEAARQLGCPLGTLRSRLERGRELLGARLGRRGVSPAAPLLAGLSAAAAVPVALPSGGILGSASPRAAALALSVGGLSWAVPLGLCAAVVLAGLAAGVLTLRSPRQAPGGSPAPATQARTATADDQEKPLPPGAVARLGTLRLRQGALVRSLALSRDGRRLVTIGWDNRIRLWDAASGNELHCPELKEPSRMEAVDLAPDSKTVAFATFNSFKLLDMTSGRVVRTLDQGLATSVAKSVAVSPDGKTVATFRDGGVVLWAAATGARLARHEATGSEKVPPPAAALAWSGDGTRLAWADGRTVRIRDMRTGKVDSGAAEASQPIHAVALSPDGKRLATSSRDRTVQLWDVASRKVLRTFKGHAKAPHCLAFSPDGKLLATGSGDPVQRQGGELDGLRLWDTATGKELANPGRYAEGVSGVCFSPDGRRLYCGSDTSVRVWDVKAKKEILFGTGHHGWVGAVAYSPDGRTLATAGSDTTVRLWDARTRKERRTLAGCQAAIDSLAFRPGGAMLAAGARDGAVVVWELPSGKEVARLKACKEGREVRAVFSPHGKRLAAVSRRGQVTLWDAASLKEVRQLPHKEPGVVSLAFAPNSKRLAIGCSGEEERWDGWAADQVRLWDVVRGVEVRRFEGVGQLFVTSVQFSPDGRLLAAGNWDGSIELWDALTGRLRWRGTAPIGGQRIAFSPDGRMLASTGHEGFVCLWEAATGAARRRWKGHLGGNVAVAFAPDGRTVATGGMDTTVLLWDVRGLQAGPKARAAEHWKALAGRDAARAYDAVLALAQAPEASVAFLRGRLRPARALAAKVKDLLADLDSDDFARREEATRALRQLGAAAEPALGKVYQASPSLEVRLRAGRLLDELARRGLSPEELRAVRAVEALEYCGAAGARELLETLSRGAPEARLTQEAKAALARRPAR